MAIVIGAVSVQEHQQVREAGYALASFDEVRDLLLRCAGENGDHAIAVWVDCDVTDILVLDETERTIKVAADDVRKVAARMGATLADHEAERIAAQVAAHLRETIEGEIEHVLDT